MKKEKMKKRNKTKRKANDKWKKKVQRRFLVFAVVDVKNRRNVTNFPEDTNNQFRGLTVYLKESDIFNSTYQKHTFFK